MALADGVSFQAAAAGTAAFAFGTARASFLTPTQAVAAGELVDGQTVSYLAQDSLSAPTQREWGRGTFHAAGGGSISRTAPFITIDGNTVNTGAPLSFTTAPYVSLTVLAEDLTLPALGGRTVAAADIVGFINAATGSDSNPWPGTSGAPLATVQYAWDYGATRTDGAGYSLTFDVAAGTNYTLVTDNAWFGWQSVFFSGAGSSTTKLINGTVGNLYFPGTASRVRFDGFTLVDDGTSINNAPFFSEGDMFIRLGSGGGGDIVIDTTANSSSYGITNYTRSQIYVGSITHNGDAQSLFNTDVFSNMFADGVVTFNNNTYLYGLAWANNSSAIVLLNSFAGVGGAGPKWLCYEGAQIKTQSLQSAWPVGFTDGLTYGGGQVTSETDDYTSVPTSDGTVVMVGHVINLDPAGSLASLTIVLPVTNSGAIQANGVTAFDNVRISTTQAIAAVTWATTDGSAIKNGFPSSLVAGQMIWPFYGPSSNAWYPGGH